MGAVLSELLQYTSLESLNATRDRAVSASGSARAAPAGHAVIRGCSAVVEPDHAEQQRDRGDARGAGGGGEVIDCALEARGQVRQRSTEDQGARVVDLSNGDAGGERA